MWWLTGPQSLCQMFIRRLCFRFSVRPQPQYLSLHAYCLFVTTTYPITFSSFFTGPREWSKVCLSAFQKATAIKMVQQPVLFLFGYQTTLLDILQRYLPGNLSLALQGTSSSSLKDIIHFQIHHSVFLVSSHQHFTSAFSIFSLCQK